MQHYFAKIDDGYVHLSENDAHHLLHVMRNKVGDSLIAIDNGKEYLADIKNLSPLTIEVIEELDNNNELESDITLLYCLAKGDKIEFVIQKATELGAKKIALISSKYCVSKIDNEAFKKKYPRYHLIAKEASEQCHRQIIPEIVGVYDINKLPPELLSDVNLVAYEKCEDSPLLEIKGKSISILIGSEGGFDKKEIENLKNAGFKSVSLGKRILRTETAAVYALSVLGYYLEK